jgi:hypothetical protein
MLRIRHVSPVVLSALLVGISSSEDREWEEANQLLVKASEAETFKPEQPKIPGAIYQFQ